MNHLGSWTVSPTAPQASASPTRGSSPPGWARIVMGDRNGAAAESGGFVDASHEQLPNCPDRGTSSSRPVGAVRIRMLNEGVA
jgi:hypothetical protein